VDAYTERREFYMDTNNGIVNAGKSIMDMIVNCTSDNSTTFLDTLEITLEQMDGLVDQYNQFLDDNDPMQETYSYTLETMYQGLELDWVKNDTDILQAATSIVNAIQRIEDTRVRLIELRQCTTIHKGYKSMRDASCEGGVWASNLLWISFLIMAVILTVTTFVTSLAYKRFRKRAFDKPVARLRQHYVALDVQL
jgi:hypothetical protein